MGNEDGDDREERYPRTDGCEDVEVEMGAERRS